MFGSWTYDESRLQFGLLPWNNKTEAEFLKCLSEKQCGNLETPRQECETCFAGEPMGYEKNGVIIAASNCILIYCHFR